VDEVPPPPGSSPLRDATATREQLHLRQRYVFAAALPVVAIAGGSLFAASTWVGGLCRHWSHLAAVLLILALPLCWPLRRRMLILGIAALAGALPWVLTALRDRAPTTDHGTSVLSANLYDFNRRRNEVLTSILNSNADLVGVQEVLIGDEAVFAAQWPYRVWPGRELLASALLSRHPITRSVIHDLDEFALIDADVALPDGSLRVLVVHLWSPKKPDSARRRDAQLRRLAELIAERAGPVLLLGDCNSSLVSPAMTVLREAGLRPPAGLRPATWPAWLGPWGTDLDQVLGRGVRLSPASVVDLPGSDHRGLRLLLHLDVR
jgi:endonuclease/exonuclease/phosphatase (EEP) superfamily protein YafD